MRRFTTNIWWIFILALVLGAAALTGSVGTARADDSQPWDSGGGGTPPPDPVSAGDPDIPTAPGRGPGRGGGIIHRQSDRARLSMGDRGVSGYQGIQWQLRIRIVAQQVFRTYFVRF